jgi:hypothetical protein
MNVPDNHDPATLKLEHTQSMRGNYLKLFALVRRAAMGDQKSANQQSFRCLARRGALPRGSRRYRDIASQMIRVR